MLQRSEIAAIYDRLGARQDRGARYEDPAIDELIAHASFPTATSVVEFGSGTGRVAARLLRQHLPATARYAAVDLSATMTHLTAARLAPWAERTLVARSSGEPHLPFEDATCDRFVSMYVLDILAPEQITALLAEARRILRPDGRVCLISLTFGATPWSSLKSLGWRAVYRARPALVGGCRPIAVSELLDTRWQVEHTAVVTAAGMSSEVVIAAPR